MSLGKIGRLPHRLAQDTKIIAITKNWREILRAKISRKPISRIEFRNGVILSSPDDCDLIFLFHEIWLDKIYSPKGYEIKPNETIIDIGANIGVFSLYAATAAPKTKVLAFEPFPENVGYFTRNVADSQIKNVVVEGKAVARDSKPRNLEITGTGITHMLSDRQGSENIVVNCTTLDEILGDLEKCDLLKIDCEGSEYEIFYSCRKENLKKVQKIVGEYHYRNDSDQNGNALKTFLEQNSFAVEHFVPFNTKVGLICAIRRD